MTKTDAFFVLPKVITDRLTRIRGNLAYKIAMTVFYEGCISEAELLNKVIMDRKSLHKSVKALLANDIITKVRSEDGNVVYIISKNVLTKMKLTCSECSHGKLERKKVGSVTVRCIECSNKSDVECICNKLRLVHNAYKVLMLSYKEVGVETLKRDHKETVIEQSSGEWNKKDFVIYIMELYESFYPEVYLDKEFRYTISRRLARIINAIKKLNEGAWRRLLKCYLYTQFNEIKDKRKMISWKLLSDPIFIKKQIEKFTDEITECGKCKIHKIYCKYVIEDKCALIRDGIKCTSKIISHMKKRYN